MFAFGKGDSGKAKKEAQNVSLQEGELPQGYDPELLKKALQDICKRAPIKANKFNYNYMRVVEQYQKGNVQQAIADAQTVLMESRKADFYRDLANAAMSITNCNWYSQESTNAKEIMTPISMICYAAAHEDPYMFPTLITAANQLYLFKGEEFKTRMHTEPFSLFNKSFADLLYKPVPLREAMVYAQAILESYGFKLEIPEEAKSRADELEKEAIEEQRATLRQKMESYPSNPSIAGDVPLPNPDQMSVMNSTMATHAPAKHDEIPDALSITAIRNCYANSNNKGDLEAVYVDGANDHDGENVETRQSVLKIEDLMANIRETSSQL